MSGMMVKVVCLQYSLSIYVLLAVAVLIISLLLWRVLCACDMIGRYCHSTYCHYYHRYTFWHYPTHAIHFIHTILVENYI